MKRMLAITVMVPLLALGAAAQNRQTNAGRPSAMGTVTAINGDSVTIQMPDGQAQTVPLAADAQVMRMTTATKRDIKVGDHIGVHRGPNGSGQMVMVCPAGAACTQMMQQMHRHQGMHGEMGGMQGRSGQQGSGSTQPAQPQNPK
jgi:hypothetical protein